jgi:predicted O-methyltransferase YrrM
MIGQDAHMSQLGTVSYDGVVDVPGPVAAAVAAATGCGFEESCRPEHGRLLRLLAAGAADGRIGETGTGCGVGLAWLGSGAGGGARLVSVERDPSRAAIARRVLADDDRVTVLDGDWRALLEHAPFDLLVLDGGGSGKTGDEPVDVAMALTFGGTVVIDDFTPFDRWPPEHLGRPDSSRRFWLEHPSLLATEVRLAPDLSTVVGRRIR